MAPSSYLIFWCIVTLWEIPIDLPVMKQVVVDQVPAPALVVAAQQGHVALALHGRPLRGEAYHRHSAKGAFPPDLPGVPPFRKANLAPGAVRALGDGVAVQGEAVLLHVNIAGAVVGAQSVLEGLELQRRRGQYSQQTFM